MKIISSLVLGAAAAAVGITLWMRSGQAPKLAAVRLPQPRKRRASASRSSSHAKAHNGVKTHARH